MRNFAERFASMSDEQLLYEADQSEGLEPEARVAMRVELKKRGINCPDKLMENFDYIKIYGDSEKEKNALSLRENKIIRWIIFLTLIALSRYFINIIR